MLWRPQIFLFGLSRHLWRVYAHTNKVEAIQALEVPKTRKKLRQFIGMINFSRDLWQNLSEIIAPLTPLTSKNVKYE